MGVIINPADNCVVLGLLSLWILHSCYAGLFLVSEMVPTVPLSLSLLFLEQVRVDVLLT